MNEEFAFPNGHAAGMSLRDYFAGQALVGICAHRDTWGLSESEITVAAYNIADLMMQERNANAK